MILHQAHRSLAKSQLVGRPLLAVARSHRPSEPVDGHSNAEELHRDEATHLGFQ